MQILQQRGFIISGLDFTEYVQSDKTKDNVIAKSCSKGGCDEKYRMGEMLTSKREEKRHLGREY